MNAESLLESGAVVSVELNFPELGTDTVSIDSSDLRAEVYTHGYFRVLRGTSSLGQYRVAEDASDHWSVYERTGIAVGRSVVVGPDRLRALGMLLEELS